MNPTDSSSPEEKTNIPKSTFLNNNLLWYAVWTRYRHEDLVKIQLEERNFQVFLPKVKSLSKRKDRKRILEKSLFPGYLFTRVALDPENYLRIVRCQGVVRVLGYKDHNKEYVPDEVINSIMNMVRDNRPVKVLPEVIKGDKIRIIGGPLDGCVGTVIEIRGEQHLVVAVELLSRSVSVVLGPDATLLPVY